MSTLSWLNFKENQAYYTRTTLPVVSEPSITSPMVACVWCLPGWLCVAYHCTQPHQPCTTTSLPPIMPDRYMGQHPHTHTSLTHIIKHYTVETLYSTIYYSKYFIELNFDKSTQYVALWTHKRHPIPRPFGRAMECLLWVLQQKLTVL